MICCGACDVRLALVSVQPADTHCGLSSTSQIRAALCVGGNATIYWLVERYEGLVKLSLCLASGVAAGTSASILTQPADVVKTYMQTTYMQTERKPVVSSILHIYRVSNIFYSTYIQGE